MSDIQQITPQKTHLDQLKSEISKRLSFLIKESGKSILTKENFDIKHKNLKISISDLVGKISLFKDKSSSAVDDIKLWNPRLFEETIAARIYQIIHPKDTPSASKIRTSELPSLSLKQINDIATAIEETSAQIISKELVPSNDIKGLKSILLAAKLVAPTTKTYSGLNTFFLLNKEFLNSKTGKIFLLAATLGASALGFGAILSSCTRKMPLDTPSKFAQTSSTLKPQTHTFTPFYR
ncbi:MAG: hypothetical protein LBU87_05070 [Lactobacillales bacterium]|nr:hypothetical protein [Lactobacillales bacterium]